MNQFYEQELPDITRVDTSEHPINEEGSGKSKKSNEKKGGAQSNSNTGVEKRRYMKKDKQEKAKEKLWESIIKETEGEDESSDTSEEEDH